MIDVVSASKSPTCFTCFGIANLSNFAVKSLLKLGGCLKNFFSFESRF